MFKKMATFIFSSLFLANLYGCAALLVGAASGAGTAVWLSEKLTQEVNAPFDRAIEAAKSALKSLKLEVTKETKEENIAQIMGKYADGKTIWIDIRRITQISSKIDVRVGAVNSDKGAAAKILKAINRHL